MPEYQPKAAAKRKDIPPATASKNFEELFKYQALNTDETHEESSTLKEQEKKLIKYIEASANQRSFVVEYIKAGLSADTDFNGRITPPLFIKYFFVERKDKEEDKYKRTIGELFASYYHNMLCIQSDGGSGKSVFLKTIAFRYAQQKRNSKYKYSNIIFDFSDIYDKSVSKEDAIFQKFKKIYRRIMSGIIPGWKEKFRAKLNKLKEVEFSNTELMFKLVEFEYELKQAIELLVPQDNLDDWYIGYSKRASSMKNSASKDILFTLLMTFYLFALESKPFVRKEDRYVIIFDNIETFDNGQMTMEISEYVQKCYGFIQKIYGELNNKDVFFTKFTFVVSMRTSTFLPFGNKQTNMWGQEKYIKRIEFYDFTVDALIKKIVFLKNIRNYKKTYLYKTLCNVLSIIVSQQYIDSAINYGGEISKQDRYFTTYRYLPLFNNNYRLAMEYICNALTNDDTCNTYLEFLELLPTKYGLKYDYLINGIRMMIIRHIFDDLQSNGYLKIIGFPQLSGEESYSMTRMMLEYLYWNEVRHYSFSPQLNYEGVAITNLIWVFKHFCSETRIANTLYDLSIYIKRNRNKANALYAWAYLIYYKNLDADLSEDEFKKIIFEVCKHPNKPFNFGGVEIDPNQIKVKLSDAGMCFVQHYLRNMEFLMARNDKGQGALFTHNDESSILSYTNTVYKIIRNCIKKIIAGGEDVCKLYGHDKDSCVYETRGNSFDVMECALFIRYQESLDMIREAIDYIDRFRISYCERHTNAGKINITLLDEIQRFYNLYKYVNAMILKYGCNHAIHEFIKIWDGKFDEKCAKQLNNCNKKRIERCRMIRNYYACYGEDISGVIKNLKDGIILTSVYEKANQA